VSQLPVYFGPRKATIKSRTAHALALWRSRDGILSPATENTPIAINTFTGNTARLMKDSLGRLVPVAEYMMAPGMWDLDGDGVLETPVLITGDGDSNRVPYSQDFTNWTATNAPSILSSTLTLGELVLSLLEDNSGSLQEYYQSQAISATGLNARTVFSFFIAKGTSSAAAGSGVQVWDNTASALRSEVTWTWAQTSKGIWKPTIAVGTGLNLALEYFGRHAYAQPTTNLLGLADVWRVYVRSTTAFAPGNVNYFRVYPAFTAAQQGNEFFGGFMASSRSSPYIKTTTTGDRSNGANTWIMTFSGAPQALTLAVRFIYTGSAVCHVSGQQGMVAGIGPVGGGNPQMSILASDASAANFYYAFMNNGSNSITVLHNTTPSAGDLVLLRLAVRADGSIVLGQSLNGGAEVAVTSGNPFGLPANWGANTALRLVEGAFGKEQYLGVGVFAGEPTAQYLLETME
jgi:hypothetical protein